MYKTCVVCCASRRGGMTGPISCDVDLTGRLRRRINYFREMTTNNNNINNNIGYYYVTETNTILRWH